MSLQIWLPLTKNSLNYGCHSSNVTENGVTLNTNGKIGGCYSFTNSAYLMGTHSLITNTTNEWSFACWMKLNATTVGQTLFSCRTSASERGITIFYYGSQWLIDDGVRWQFTPKTAISTNRWYHICVIRKKGVGKYLYIDGVLDSSTTTTGTPTIVNTSKYAIGVCQNSASTVSGNPLNGYLNDARFYDQALSEVEIKEIAKGLVCHYKLDDVQSSDNLIINGFGELGSENWTSTTNISTTEIPSGHPEIKSSFYSGNMTKEYIPISQNHTYTISGYIKGMQNQTGTTYPSIYPYDIDKKFIAHHMTSAGFYTATVTTLRLPLHKGDTIIYANDLSQWSTGDNYYFHAAIFGYENSYGEVYPDLIYTNDVPSFGTKTDKSNIDKTNNTITLLSAFTGEDRPAGTTICQSTEGSTYYYPWGGIALTSITDWVAKTYSFKPKSVNRLKGGCAFIRWSTYGRCYIAGSKLVDNFFNDDTIIDSSGYNNHGTRNGNITVSASTPRYSYSTVFDGSSAYIDINSAIFPVILNESFTLSMWVYNSDSGDRSILFGNYGLTGSFFNIEKTTAEKVRFYWNASPDVTLSNTSLTVNEFSHLVITKSGNTVKSYINGVLKDTSTTTLSGSIPATATHFRIGADSRTNSTMFKGRVSDFRLYATALSADDIKRLYEVSASVSKNGSMLGYEMKEG